MVAGVSPADGAALVAAAGSLGLAWSRSWLTARALPVAALVGAAVWWGGGPPAVGLLLYFFLSSSVLTRIRRRRARSVHPGGAGAGHRHRSGRTGWQVLANGAAATAAALAGALFGFAAAGSVIAGALAAATADTWASEVGRAAAGRTWLITTGEPVSPGRSGGLSVAGTAAGLAGAASAGLLWGILGGSGPLGGAAVALAAGATGMMLDSLLGATVESRVAWIGNDFVNLAGTVAGAVVGWILAAHAAT